MEDLVQGREWARRATLEQRRAAASMLVHEDDLLTRKIDLRPLMELSPRSVLHSMPMPRVHETFVALGLRHLYVTDVRNNVVGVITRKDLLPEVLEANRASFSGGGGGNDGGPPSVAAGTTATPPARLERMATFTSQRLADAARPKRHEPRVPAHTLRSQRRAGLQKMRRGSYTFASNLNPLGQPMDSSSFHDASPPACAAGESVAETRRRSNSYNAPGGSSIRSSTRIAALQLSPRSRPEPPPLQRGSSE